MAEDEMEMGAVEEELCGAGTAGWCARTPQAGPAGCSPPRLLRQWRRPSITGAGSMGSSPPGPPRRSRRPWTTNCRGSAPPPILAELLPSVASRASLGAAAGLRIALYREPREWPPSSPPVRQSWRGSNPCCPPRGSRVCQPWPIRLFLFYIL